MNNVKRHTVYLDNWMINAGVVGFLNILLTPDEQQKIIESQDVDELFLRNKKIRLSHNKLEFENAVLAENGNFAKKFFQEAFKRYGRYGRYLDRLQKINTTITQFQKLTDEKEITALKDKIKREWEYKGSYSLLEKKYEAHYKQKLKLSNKLSDRSFTKDELKKLGTTVSNCLTVLKDNQYYLDFFENDAQFYLSNYFADDKTGIKKQSGFLNVSVTGSKEKHFYTNVIEPIISNSVEYDKKYNCIMENIPAKKNSSYNSGLVPFFGHPGNENYFWLGAPSKLPLGEISELIYWSSFAGFADLSRGTNIRFLFCNQDSSIIDLYGANYKLSQEFQKDTDNSTSYINFLLKLILSEKEKSTYELQNTVLVDIDNSKGLYAKIHSLYISREKAKFIDRVKNLEKLNSLAKISFIDNGISKSIGLAVLERILKDSLNYPLLHYITKMATSGNKEGCYIKSGILQNINYLINNYYRSFYYRSEYMKNEELYQIYQHGQKVAHTLKARNDENKIKGIVHKFLGFQKTGNINAFMNLFMRIHMAYGLMTKESIIKCMENEVNFNAFGYSFINGLLNVINQEKSKEGEKENENE